MGLQKSDGEYIFEHWKENGWTRGGRKIRDWRLCIKTWMIGGYFPSQKKPKIQEPQHQCPICGIQWKLNEVGAWVYQCKCFEQEMKIQ